MKSSQILVLINMTALKSSCFCTNDCGGHSEPIIVFWKPLWEDLSIVSWFIILLEVAIRRWVHCDHKETDMVSNNSEEEWKWCSVGTKPSPWSGRSAKINSHIFAAAWQNLHHFVLSLMSSALTCHKALANFPPPSCKTIEWLVRILWVCLKTVPITRLQEAGFSAWIVLKNNCPRPWGSTQC